MIRIKIAAAIAVMSTSASGRVIVWFTEAKTVLYAATHSHA
jgi:hypothetical protein